MGTPPRSTDAGLDRRERAERLQAAADKLAEEADADILFVNSGMDGGVETSVIKMVCARARRANVYLILTTEGGNADAAFRIARCLQETYETFTAVVPGWCKSAGTLVCIGAYDLVIGDLGELGPLDVQVAKPDELGLISSGLTIDSAFRSLQSVAFQMFETFLLDTLNKSGGRITTKTAAELAANITVGLLSPIFQQMDPMKVGEDFRSTRIAEHYALRLDAHANAQNLIHDDGMDAIEALVRGYPSHGFVIDRTEAQSLFQRVAPLEGALAEVVEAIGDGIATVSSPRQQAIVQYLNREVDNEERTETTDGAPAGRKPSGRTDQPKDRLRRSLPSNPPKGDGNVAISVSDGSSGTGEATPSN